MIGSSLSHFSLDMGFHSLSRICNPRGSEGLSVVSDLATP